MLNDSTFGVNRTTCGGARPRQEENCQTNLKLKQFFYAHRYFNEIQDDTDNRKLLADMFSYFTGYLRAF